MCPLIAIHCLKLRKMNMWTLPCLHIQTIFSTNHAGSSQAKTKIHLVFRLRIGHCKLNSHIFTLGHHPAGMWWHFQETVNHYLSNWPAFQPQRLKLQKATNKLGIRFGLSTLLTHEDTAELIETYIRDTGKHIWSDHHQTYIKQLWRYMTAVIITRHQPPSPQLV